MKTPKNSNEIWDSHSDKLMNMVDHRNTMAWTVTHTFCDLADNKQIHSHWLKPIFMTIWWLQLMPSWPTTHRSAASRLTQSAAVKTSLLECSSIFFIYLHQILKFVTLPLCLRRGNLRHKMLNQQQASWNVVTLAVKNEVLWLNKERPTWCHLLYYFII